MFFNNINIFFKASKEKFFLCIEGSLKIELILLLVITTYLNFRFVKPTSLHSKIGKQKIAQKNDLSINIINDFPLNKVFFFIFDIFLFYSLKFGYFITFFLKNFLEFCI